MGEFLRRGIFAGIAAVVIFCGSAPLWAETPPGPIKIAVDARQAPQKILHSHLQFPVKPGPLTLYYPQWIPGEHMPDGPIIDLGGLKFQAGGKTIPWRRDLVDMFAFHLEIPPGATSLDADLDFLLNAPASGFSAGASATASLDVLSWNQVLLYPKGYKAHELTFVPSLRLPDGWKYGTALPGAKQNGDTIQFSPVTLNTLVDSPVLAGKYFRVIQLTPGQDPPHELDIAADSQAALEMSPDMQKAYRQLVAETGALFGSRHYRDYHFLVTLSDDVAHFGLEHHESSDDRSNERSLLDEALRMEFSGLLPHEFVHSWNGKFRRPADLSTPDYQQPMKDDLLWVYEGLTEYLGVVLTARSGLLTQEQSGIFRALCRDVRAPSRARLAAASGHRGCGSLSLRCKAGMVQLAARGRFLRRGIFALARRGRQSAPADERQQVDERFLQNISRRAGRRAGAQDLHIRRCRGDAE